MRITTRFGEFDVKELSVKDRRKLSAMFTACHQHQDGADGARLAALCEESLALHGLCDDDVAALGQIEQVALAQELVFLAIGGDSKNS
jgi:hypothetical protein